MKEFVKDENNHVVDSRHINFFQVENHVFDLGLTHYELAVYFYLVRCAGNKSTCFPSLSNIALKTQISRAGVSKAIKSLVKNKLILKEQTKRPGSRLPLNIYHIIDIKKLVTQETSSYLNTTGHVVNTTGHTVNCKNTNKEYERRRGKDPLSSNDDEIPWLPPKENTL
jgi:predicted transcriptional regulator